MLLAFRYVSKIQVPPFLTNTYTAPDFGASSLNGSPFTPVLLEPSLEAPLTIEFSSISTEIQHYLTVLDCGVKDTLLESIRLRF
jgi:hypothetical protein